MDSGNRPNERSDSSDGADELSSNRRNFLQLTGLAAFGGTAAADGTGNDARAGRASQMCSVYGSGFLPVGRFGFSTIQEAWEAASNGDVIFVTGSYDAQEAGEDFPIVLDYNEKEVQLTGGHSAGTVIDAGDANENVLHVIGLGAEDYLNQPAIKSLTIRGGQIGLRVQGSPFAAFQNLIFHETGSDGVLVDKYENSDGPLWGSHSVTFYNCQAFACGGAGFRSIRAADSHETYYLACRATNNQGAGFHVRGSASKIMGGVAQLNHGPGVVARAGNSITVDSVYIEGNGRSDSYPVDVFARGTAALTVENCYCHAINPRPTPGHDYQFVQRGVNLYEVDTANVQNCSGRRYGDGMIGTVKSTDVDIYATSHQIDETSLLATRPPEAYGTTRVRSNGMILPTDLRDVDGVFAGDVGYHVGPDREGPAYWRDGQWHVASTETL